MYFKYANLTKEEMSNYILPFIPKKRRGFRSSFSMSDMFRCIVHKLKTGCQWKFLFVDIDIIKPPFSWQTVYYYRKWCKHNVFEKMFRTYSSLQKDKLDTEKLNLDGTHTIVKRRAENVGYQHRKKAKTSNILIMTDGQGIPIANGGVIGGNHNDLYHIITQYSVMIKQINSCGICVENRVQNADKGFDSKALRRCIARRKLFANIKPNPRNRKKKKREPKPYFNEYIYKTRFVNERCFAWIDSFRTLLIRFDTLDNSWINWHYIAFALILLKV